MAQDQVLKVVDLVFKAAVVILLPWAVWVTKESFENKAFRAQGGRFNQDHALVMRAETVKMIAEAKTEMVQMVGSNNQRSSERFEAVRKDVQDNTVLLNRIETMMIEREKRDDREGRP